MTYLRIASMFAALLPLIAPPGRAADEALQLTVPPPVRRHLAAMPQITHPADDAQVRINAALRRLDASVRRALDGCRGFDGKTGHWERSVEVPMRGPVYISFVIVDDLFCGGAHPDVGTMAIVYDLRTGAPVDWTHLLPPELTGTVALQEGVDGTKMVTLASKRLFELYVAGYRTGDGEADAPAECREALEVFSSDGPPAMMAWLDSKNAGLVVQFDLPHAVKVCEKPVVISAAALRTEGANAALLDAIGAPR